MNLNRLNVRRSTCRPLISASRTYLFVSLAGTTLPEPLLTMGTLVVLLLEMDSPEVEVVVLLLPDTDEDFTADRTQAAVSGARSG